MALASAARLVGALSELFQVQFLVRAHAWVSGSVPGPGAYNPQERPIREAAYRCSSPSLPLSLKSMKKCPRVRVFFLNTDGIFKHPYGGHLP